MKEDFKKSISDETKFCSGNLIKGINACPVSLVRDSGPFLKWMKDELMLMNQRTRKLMPVHKAWYPRNEIDRLYVSKKGRGRELARIEDRMNASIWLLKDFIKKQRII